jgi:hypothetical protein
MYKEKMGSIKDYVAFNSKLLQHENMMGPVSGTVIFEFRDTVTGELTHRIEKKNVVTLDAGIHTARLYKDNAEPNYGAYMLAVGTGATGNLLSPDAADSKQRKLNTEIERKAFASTTFRTSSGVAVAYPTNIVDFTCQFLASEAVGALNEMGIISPISANPAVQNLNPNTFPTYDNTLDITTYDVLLNYLTFPVKSKLNTEILTITWRLTFGSGA